MADPDRTFRANYVLSDVTPERVFEALLAVEGFTEWAFGLRSVRVVDAAGRKTSRPTPGATIEFVLEAAGLTHTVTGEVSAIQRPRLLQWRYVHGATGTGGWHVEEAGSNTVEITLSTDYAIKPAWLNRLAHRPFFKRLTEDLLRRSIRRFERKLRSPKPEAKGRSGPTATG